MDFKTTGELTEYAVRQHLDMLMRLAYQRTLNFADAEDIAQETFLRLMRREPVEFLDDEHLCAWLIRVTLNLCRDLARRKGRREATQLPDDIPVSDEFPALIEEVSALPRHIET